MSLFQKSVVNKYLKNLDRQVLLDKWNAYKNHFLNPSVQVDIRNLKEEQYQGEFLEDLFVKILGYTKPASSSETKFNLTTEYKNVKDSKKADGAIIFDDKVKAVIELKGTNTTDLGKIEVQAFGYKNNQPDCVYVITSNFEKLRFYIDNAIEHIEFNLFTLSEEEFQLLYLCLGYDNLSQNVGKKIKEESLSEEDVITKKLYKDYSLFKRELHQNLVLLNPDFEPLELFKKSQKLLDRFLFLFFGEDRHLLAPNSVRQIITDWNKLQELNVYMPLYDRFKEYFRHLNTGFKSKNYDVFAYNGGLFKTDEVLDSISIDDDLLYKHTLKLSEYDFASEVDVNILGHIFENSLNELDEIKAQLEGQEIDKSKTKRKKDGVFYTPKYITKYIVENTVGKLCEEKKQALEILEEEYFTDKKRQKKTIQGLVEKLDAYRKWLLQLTICDPACGSGAFLNQALDFLIEEHQYIDELQAKLFGDAMVLSDIENSILENNLFGVDLNEESVEIAKLSLWLRTAQPNRKLNDLSGNLKCGNSLIDDVAVAGDKAFNWEQSFPKVFEKGGFDVIIGNPPYVKEYTNKSAFDGLHNHPCYQGKMDLWYFFGWLGIEIIKPEIGLIGFIAPNNWITNSGASVFRNIVLEKGKIIEFVDFGDFKVFDSAGIQTMIYIMSNSKDNNDYKVQYSKVIDKNINHETAKSFLIKLEDDKFSYFNSLIQKDILKDKFILFTDNSFEIVLNKIEKNEVFYLNKNEVAQGIVSPQDYVNGSSLNILGEGFEIGDGIFNLSNNEYENLNLTAGEKELVKPFYTSKELSKYYGNPVVKYWVIYTDSKFKNENEILPFTNLKNHLDKFKTVITSDNKPYGLHRAREERFFKGNKILSIRKAVEPTFTYVEFDSYVSQSYYLIQTDKIDLKALVVILNSKLIKFWLKYKGKMQGDIFQIDKEPLLNIPFIKPKIEMPFIEKTELMLNLNKDLQEQSQRFLTLLESDFNIKKPTKKIENWYNLSWSEFEKELHKLKIILLGTKKEDWLDRFNRLKTQAQDLQNKINQTDKAIDKLVYELYGLNEEEIALVENS